MEVESQLQGKRVYIDTNILMYLFEGAANYQAVLESILEGIEQQYFEAVSSDLTLAELLVKPLKVGNGKLAEQYRDYLEQDDGINLISVSRNDFIQAAFIRSQTKLKLPDSLHLACAMSSECDMILTNDKAFQSSENLKVIQLSEL